MDDCNFILSLKVNRGSVSIDRSQRKREKIQLSEFVNTKENRIIWGKNRKHFEREITAELAVKTNTLKSAQNFEYSHPSVMYIRTFSSWLFECAGHVNFDG